MDLRSRYDRPVPAIVLAEGAFGTPNGKTANGVVMHSELFDARAVIDSTCQERFAGDVLSNPSVTDVPVVDSMRAALDCAPESEGLVLGVAPAGGELPTEWDSAIRIAMEAGCDVISGLHVFLSEDPDWRKLADNCGVDIVDVRKPPSEEDLRVADGRSDDVTADVVLVTGTDCAVGKRTTTMELYTAARRAGVDAAWVATGQTGIMVGAQRGVVVDRVPADFAAGVVEEMVTDLGESDTVFVEGQASLTHRAYGGVTLSILCGACPDAVVIADDPARDRRTHFESYEVPPVEREATLITELSTASVAGVSTWGDPETMESEHDYPTVNVYHDGGSDRLFRTVRAALESNEEDR